MECKGVWPLKRTSYSGHLTLLILEKKNELISHALAGPVKEMMIRNTARDTNKQITQLRSRQKIPKRFTQADKSNNKAHTPTIKVAMYSNICLAFNLIPDLSCSNMTIVSLENLHKRPSRSRLLVCDATLAMMSEPMFTLEMAPPYW